MPGIFDNKDIFDIIENIAEKIQNERTLYGQNQVNSSGFKLISNNLFTDVSNSSITYLYDNDPSSSTYQKHYIMCGVPISDNIIFNGDRNDPLELTIPPEESWDFIEI